MTSLDAVTRHYGSDDLLSEIRSGVELVQGNAMAMDFPAGTFHKAFLLHVGMNIPDKHALAAEAWRVLKPGGVLGVYDVMRTADGDLTFPVPWATTSDTSFVGTLSEYKDALETAGFLLRSERDRSGVAMQFFQELQEASARREGPPPLGLHILMGPDAQTKVRNMISNVLQGTVAPVELIAQKPQ